MYPALALFGNRGTLPPSIFQRQTDGWQSGLMRTPGKRVWLIANGGSNPPPSASRVSDCSSSSSSSRPEGGTDWRLNQRVCPESQGRIKIKRKRKRKNNPATP